MSGRILRARHAVIKDGVTLTEYSGGDEVASEHVRQLDEQDALWPAGDKNADSAGPIAGDYGSHDKDDLQAEADRRGLAVEGSGKDGNVLKDDLVQALDADDAENDPPQ